jgi:hypothetical protein
LTEFESLANARLQGPLPSLSPIRCLLFVGCHLLSAVCCLLSTVYCLLSAVCCLLSPVFCVLSVVCCLLSGICRLPPAAFHLPLDLYHHNCFIVTSTFAVDIPHLNICL